MENKEWIMIASAFIVAAGWFVTGYLNRAKDVAQKRLEYRLSALEAFLPVWFDIQKSPTPFNQPEFLPKLENARSKFQLYGHSDEIELMENFIKAVEQPDVKEANDVLGSLILLVRQRIRSELQINL